MKVARRPLFRVDPGWPFVLAGLAMLVAVVIIPGKRTLHEMQEQLGVLRDHETRVLARAVAYSQFLENYREGDPQLIRRLAASQLNLVPEGETPVLVSSSLDEPVTGWIDEAIEIPPREALPHPDTLLSRLAEGPWRMWMLGGSVFAIFVGLVLGPESTRVRRSSRARVVAGSVVAAVAQPDEQQDSRQEDGVAEQLASEPEVEGGFSDVVAWQGAGADAMLDDALGERDGQRDGEWEAGQWPESVREVDALRDVWGSEEGEPVGRSEPDAPESAGRVAEPTAALAAFVVLPALSTLAVASDVEPLELVAPELAPPALAPPALVTPALDDCADVADLVGSGDRAHAAEVVDSREIDDGRIESGATPTDELADSSFEAARGADGQFEDGAIEEALAEAASIIEAAHVEDEDLTVTPVDASGLPETEIADIDLEDTELDNPELESFALEASEPEDEVLEDEARGETELDETELEEAELEDDADEIDVIEEEELASEVESGDEIEAVDELWSEDSSVVTWDEPWDEPDDELTRP